ncbi:transporter substrate-binding domain-containing protein [Nitratireductor sp. GISD-1A_MAKvit]|uniref:transporter substrate-binding domain-containing protein n=1 Tax=Nitratireductor sp. GISD-1A_MAKvit TaxID=3234198 RepID=UPI0034674AE7
MHCTDWQPFRFRRNPASTGAWRWIVWACLVMSLLGVQPAFAQAPAEEPARQTEVGIFLSPPFVRGEPGAYEGMAIDLWEMVSAKLGLTHRYTVYPTLRQLVAAVGAGEVEVAVTNLTITHRRAETVSFSQPWYDAGMRIMVPDEGASSFGSIVSGPARCRSFAGLCMACFRDRPVHHCTHAV